MEQVLRRLKPQKSNNLIVGSLTGDDAAVWQLDENRALVMTADFITPVIDDALTWGKVAAANAVSDVYAMGAKPLMGINLVGWNSEELSTELLSEVLEGANQVAEEAGFVIAGGHTVEDPEPKFGLAIVGEVDPRNLLRNSGFRENDLLILTKKLGVGVITTAIKKQESTKEATDAAIESMLRLNDQAAEIAIKVGATGATDITGFGLLGHLGRAARESKVDIEIDVAEVPLLPDARKLALAGNLPGGSQRNLEWIEERVDVGSVEDIDVHLLADAQTSGGLVFGVQPAEVETALKKLLETGHDAAVIGSMDIGSGLIRLLNPQK